jgi:tellurite resistance protein
MDDLYPEIDISQSEAEAIARGLFAVARADGQLHERETGVIAQFYADVAGDASPAVLGDLERSPRPEPAALAAELSRQEVRLIFIRTAVLLAYVDNKYSPGESKLIADYAAAMGIGRQDLAEIETFAREFLMAQLAHIKNIDAVVEVAKKLES